MIVVAGHWELGYNTPLVESDLWTYMLRELGVDEFAMVPVSGIRKNGNRHMLKEFDTVQDLLEHYKDLTLVIVDESSSVGLEDFKHPENVLYLFGKANYSAMGYVKSKSVKIRTVLNKGLLWPHQAAAIILYDRLAKTWH